ncbi:heterochromatin protein 1-like [Contarinia nasturtii]|uniref:heterochromatin protein 1-like n=1 Tax=Contarinia nasturtii TaxID=265458 RepID=UPI0012D379C7|nr:heterochromatin protein 1-like [Contarinia nasturtii]
MDTEEMSINFDPVEYEVERIDGKRINMGVVEYFIKWKDYPENENTWEPTENLACPKLIEEYNKSCPNDTSSLAVPVKIESKRNYGHRQVEYLVKLSDGTKSWMSNRGGSLNKLIRKFKWEQKSTSKPGPKRAKLQLDSDQSDSEYGEQLYNGTVKRILNMKRENSDVMFLVQYEEHDDHDWVSVDIIKRLYPQKVIAFYEESILWE